MATHDLLPSRCPNCGRRNNAATNVDGDHHAPEPGAAAVCISCAYVSIYGSNLQLRPPTGAELALINQSSTLRSIQGAAIDATRRN